MTEWQYFNPTVEYPEGYYLIKQNNKSYPYVLVYDAEHKCWLDAYGVVYDTDKRYPTDRYKIVPIPSWNGDPDIEIEPDYYRSIDGDLLDFMKQFLGRAETEAFCVCNVIKYLVRYPEKNGVEDLKKALTYLNRLIGMYDDE